LQRTCWLPDIVPTICYLLDLPLPKEAEGAVIYQAFENPNFKLGEISELKKSLQNMEDSLSSSAGEK